MVLGDDWIVQEKKAELMRIGLWWENLGAVIQNRLDEFEADKQKW